MIIEGLRGEAAQIAIDIGSTEILKETGFETLKTKLRNHVFPQARAEAKELYKVGHKTKGVMSRQSGEPMVNFVSR
eukprot:5205921-Karenia_brevis.AAC.1